MYEQHRVVIKKVIMDDHSSIKAKLKWSNTVHVAKHNMTTTPKIFNSAGNETPRPDYGEVPAHMLKSSFLQI